MSEPLLATKFYIPPARADLVSRPRLTGKLRAGLKRPRTFTLLSGPAGAGKTTLLSEFVVGSEQPVAWLSLDQADDEPGRFWKYLITACQSVLPGLGDAALSLLDAQQTVPDDTIPTILINDLAQQERALVLVLDDYHVIQSSAVHTSLAFLLDHLPDNLHLVVSTRVDPPWSLARYRARNQLLEIRARDLRFNQQETAEFLNRTMALNLSREEVKALAVRTEGWAAGLQLAAIALQTPQLPTAAPPRQEQSDTADFVAAFTGSHLYVAEYLLDEVLKRQTEDVQNFLLQTAILERLHGRLCDAVTGCRGGPTILANLHRANIFVIPLDAEGQWFRYHHLFADLLRARLSQHSSTEEIAGLHLRAAEWYEQNGYDAEAVSHALSAGDFKKVAALVDRAGQRIIFGDQYTQLKSWLDILPRSSFHTYPRLEIYRVLLALTKGNLDMSEQTLREKEQLIKALPPSPENNRLRVAAMVYLALFLAFQNAPRAIQIAQEALVEIPESDLKQRSFLFSALYRAHGMNGDYDKGRAAYVESLRLTQAAGHYGMVANTTMIRAFDLCQYGKLDEAAHYCRVIIDAGSDRPQAVFYSAGPAYIGLAGIYLERNQLAEAEEYLEQGIQLARQGGLYGLFTGYTQKARLYQAKGQFDAAVRELELLEQNLQRREFTLMARHVSLRRAMGDMATIVQLDNALVDLLADSAYARRLPLIAVEAFKLSLARLALAQGEYSRSGQILDEIQATVEPGKRYGRLLEVHLLRALLLQKQHTLAPSTEAVTHLEQALALGEPAGFVLLFVEEGPALIPLLQAVAARHATPSHLKQYARKLLDAFGVAGDAVIGPTLGEVADLVEPLTPRELEVLQHIAAGDSNQAIADKLFITVRTVKKHAGNIYGKLNVSSRTQAAVRARELGLLSSDR